ncbi:MAG: HlyD family efflux transporter periplasmic adaptor subunit [Candidatus Moranbacteria bacterium]|nr:HlyD family efflux transporter periplasmic adaptor subunit [Candidatus Moranbacteria bacterium]
MKTFSKLANFVKRRKIVSIIIVVVLIVGIWFLFFRKKAEPIETYTVGRGNITETVMETGNVQAAQMGIYSTTTGVIENIYVKNGDQVVEGQKLFNVKSTSTDQEKATAYYNYQNASSNLKKSRQQKESAYAQLLSDKRALTDAKVDREYQKDHDTNPQTNDDYTSKEKKAIKENVTAREAAVQSSQANYDNSDSAILAAQASVDAMKLAYDATQDSTVTAKDSGTVSNLSVGEGDMVYVSDITVTSTTIADPVLVIGNLSGYSVKVSINEVERSKTAIGQKATIKFDAISGKEYAGTVEKLDNFGVDEGGVITYNAYLTIDNPDDKILPNMTANVTVETNSKENVIVIPSKALKPYQNGKGVQIAYTGENGKQAFKHVSVQAGLKNGSQVEIVSGLKEGEVISLSEPATQEKGGGLF